MDQPPSSHHDHHHEAPVVHDYPLHLDDKLIHNADELGSHLLLRHKKKLLHIAASILGRHDEEAEDIVSVAIHNTIQRLHSIRFGIVPYTVRVVAKRSYSRVRHLIRSRELQEHHGEQLQGVTRHHDAHSEIVNHSELEHCLNTLSAEKREVVMLIKIEEWTSCEVAEHTGMTPERVRQRVHRALVEMRDKSQPAHEKEVNKQASP